jgi:hypothetical protein
VVRHEYLKVDTTVKTDHATPPLETMQAIRKELAADFSALQLLGSCAVFPYIGYERWIRVIPFYEATQSARKRPGKKKQKIASIFDGRGFRVQ